MNEKKPTKKQQKALSKIRNVGAIDILQLDRNTYSTALRLSGSLPLSSLIQVLHSELERMIDYYEANEAQQPGMTCGDYVQAVKSSKQIPS